MKYSLRQRSALISKKVWKRFQLVNLKVFELIRHFHPSERRDERKVLRVSREKLIEAMF